MIIIEPTTSQESTGFNENEWAEVNDRHFGKGIRWDTVEFRYKATENNKTVGLIYGKHESKTIYIRNIIVAKEKRRQGIGTMLVEAVEKLGKEYGDHKIWLLTGNHFEENKLFEKLGFRKETIIPDLYFNRDFAVFVKKII